MELIVWKKTKTASFLKTISLSKAIFMVGISNLLVDKILLTKASNSLEIFSHLCLMRILMKKFIKIYLCCEFIHWSYLDIMNWKNCRLDRLN